METHPRFALASETAGRKVIAKELVSGERSPRGHSGEAPPSPLGLRRGSLRLRGATGSPSRGSSKR